MLKKTIEAALNTQVNRELYSAYLYLSMSAWFESIRMKGFAHWLRVQDQEERIHAMKLFDYIVDRGGVVILTPIEAPKTSWSSPKDAFEHVYSHEQKVTGLINNLVDLSIRESDHTTNTFLQWFVTEQIEEERNASGVLGKIGLAGDLPGNLYLLDAELAQRQ